jgi:glycerol-3-phosphate dehydrogenase
VRSVFAGLRPLLAGGGRTASLSRDHEVTVGRSGLVTLAGGKWTTYRRMAVDAVDRAAEVAGLPPRGSRTETLRLDDAAAPAGGVPLGPGIPVRDVDINWAVREAMARTVEDVLARRTALLVADARAAREAAPAVARALAAALGRDAGWERAQVEAFSTLAAGREFDGLA